MSSDPVARATSSSKKRKAGNDDYDDAAESPLAPPPDSAAASASAPAGGGGTSCPYLDTIERSILDFDFEPACSVSLQSGPHIYGCLVCGKFFRGRGPQTPAYTHSVQDGHFVFVHLTTSKFYCLPDNYEIRDNSLGDIASALHPTFTTPEIENIDTNTELARDLFGRRYLPGFVGLNNLNKTDCINACVQALAHVPPLRDFFLRQRPTSFDNNNNNKNTNNTPEIPQKTISTKSTDSQIVSAHRMSQHITECFGELVRKLWSDKRFKNHIDPHMLTQGIAVASKGRFKIGQQMEAGEFMAWFLHQLHIGLGGSSRKPQSSIIHHIFQGSVQVTTRQIKQQQKLNDNNNNQQGDLRGGSDDENHNNNDDVTMKDSSSSNQQEAEDATSTNTEEITTDSHFLQLTLDISQKPLFRDADGGLVIPQEPLVTVLKKFDGVTFSDLVNKAGIAQRKRYRLKQLPPYLILHLSRFQTNQFIKEKNPTIVAFPVRNLDLSDYVFSTTTTENKDGSIQHNGEKKNQPKLPAEEELRSMSIKELKAFLTKHGREDLMTESIEKSDLLDRVVDFVTKSLPDLLADKYDLVANITHESPADVGREGQHDPLQDGSYKCHVQHRGTKQWYEIQDLHVNEIMPQLIGLSESYLLIFERKSAKSLLLRQQQQQQSSKKNKKSKNKKSSSSNNKKSKK